jgi:CRP/FNR family transcriptional regulator, cyclic AMP receptor protein
MGDGATLRSMTPLAPFAVKSDWNRATDREWADALAELPLFESVAKRELRRIARAAEFAEFAKGETVVLTSSRPDFFYVILGGTARVPARPVARVLSVGDHFGEIGLVDGGSRSASVVATSDLHVMRLPQHAFEDALERSPSIAWRLLTELATHIRSLEHHTAHRTT